MLTLVISLIVPLSLVLIFKFLNAERKPPIFGVYQQKNKTYWPKFIVMYLFLRSRQLIGHLRRLRAVDVGRSDDGTITIHEQDEPLEKKFNMGDYPLAVDAVYFNGMSKEGAAVVCGVARRPHHHVDSFMYLKVEGEELLLTPSLPDTHSTQNALEQGHYRSRGLNIKNFIPMRTWEVTYNGEMKKEFNLTLKSWSPYHFGHKLKRYYENRMPKTKGDVMKKIELNLTWSAHFGHFNYDTHMAPLSMASDMAREAWSADYFRLLKKFHQTHYEQMGHLLGTVSIDGVTKDISMPCVRDHSFGNYREWRNFHRYVLHFLFLENGDCLAVGCVSQPVILSHLTIGYLCRKDDQVIFPVKSTDFKLYQHGENGVMPKDYGFSFKAGGEMYIVKVTVNSEDSFYLGQEREAKICERWCSVEVNGVKGWGCVEWQYNNTRK